MFKLKKQNWKAYPAALLCMAAVVGLMLASKIHLGPIPTALPLLLPILLASLLGGLVPGLVATVLGTVAFGWMFEYTLDFSGSEEAINGIRFASLMIEGALLSIFGEILQMARSSVQEADAKNLELQQAKAALQQMDKKKDAFIATLAHELRNPLTPILTAAQMLKFEADPETSQWAGEVIEVQVGHLMGLVNDLLDVSRLTQGKMQLKSESLQLGAVLSQAIDIARSGIDQRKQHLILSPWQPVWLNGDGHRLVQVFANLLLNASKFTPEGGRIEIDVSRKSSQAVVSIRDSGIGIPETKLEEIFEPFMQVDRLSSGFQGGLGIGLALVKSLVELHGGRVEAISFGENQGSEFSVRLPTLPSDGFEPSVGRPSPVIGKLQKKRILVVDDNPAVTEALARLLGRLGMEVSVAANGESAIQQAKGFKPDVLLLDIGLPDKDGYEVVRELMAAEEDFQDMLIVAMTGYGHFRDDGRYALEHGFHYYLNKPIDIAELLTLIGNCRGKVAIGHAKMAAPASEPIQ